MRRWLVLLFALLCSVPAVAQDAGTVVPVCGAGAQAVYVAGSTRPVTVDVNGNLCTAGGAATGSGNAGFPPGATPVFDSTNGSATNISAAGLTLGLPAAVGKITYICGFTFDNGGATTPTTMVAHVSPLVGGFQSDFGIVVAAVNTWSFKSVSFLPCLPAAASNTIVNFSIQAAAGNPGVFANIWGYQQ